MSGGNPPPAPKTFQMPNQAGAANGAYNAIGGLEAMPNYAANAANSANSGLAAFSGNGGYDPSATVNYGNTISQMPQTYLPYADTLLREGFNQNNDVYGRAAHNLTEQVRASQGARGIQTSPYGAGLENEALGNFNLDWENAQLGRMSQAMGSALPAYAQAGQQMGYGQAVAQSVPQLGNDMFKTAAGVGNMAYAQPEAVINGYLNYTGAGNAADNTKVNAFSQQLQAWQAKQQADAAMWQGIAALGGQAVSAAANPASLFGTKLWG